MLLTHIFLTTSSLSPLHPSLAWGVTGILLGVSELMLPKAIPKAFKFMPLIMGICALIVGFLIWRSNTFYRIPAPIQIMYWMAISGATILWVRPLFRQKKTMSIVETTEAVTLTEIRPGEAGRVRFEGNSWAASCSDGTQAIAPGKKVYVLRREGNTLIIIPDHLNR